MRAGRMIHEYILQPDEFWKDYAISDAEAPKSANQKDFCTFIIDNPSFDHKHKFFRNLQSDRTLLYFSHNELRIDGFGNIISKNYNTFETFDIFLKTFGISFEDIV